jgi:hypothetical protein
MRRYLVVANQTLGGAHLAHAVSERMEKGPCSFHVLVPATQPSDHVWTEAEARRTAQGRLDRELLWFDGIGAEVTGEVGDARPMQAIADCLREREIDEIILSTLPAGVSRWLKADLLNRALRRFDIPVEHVIGEPAGASRTA